MNEEEKRRIKMGSYYERSSPESYKYSIRPNYYKGELISITLVDKLKHEAVRSVIPYNIGYLFQYSITIPQMNYLEDIEKELGIR